jgi:hypothetical protein
VQKRRDKALAGVVLGACRAFLLLGAARRPVAGASGGSTIRKEAKSVSDMASRQMTY